MSVLSWADIDIDVQRIADNTTAMKLCFFISIMYSINNQIKISPSLKVESVDTNGTGPIFRAAFAHSIVNGSDVEKAVKMGCIAAGLSTTKYGSAASIPTLEEIKNIYEQNY